MCIKKEKRMQIKTCCKKKKVGVNIKVLYLLFGLIKFNVYLSLFKRRKNNCVQT